ncbi:unnamed protein product [Amoebophrya sp. A25]|nr:unnamed protein product [Amoebophrya sp. A25]|eukprot:GSA25T00027898001.1
MFGIFGLSGGAGTAPGDAAGSDSVKESLGGDVAAGEVFSPSKLFALPPTDLQKACYDWVLRSLAADSKGGAPAVFLEAPVGSGKTNIILGVVNALRDLSGSRSLVVSRTHKQTKQVLDAAEAQGIPAIQVGGRAQLCQVDAVRLAPFQQQADICNATSCGYSRGAVLKVESRRAFPGSGSSSSSSSSSSGSSSSSSSSSSSASMTSTSVTMDIEDFKRRARGWEHKNEKPCPYFLSMNTAKQGRALLVAPHQSLELLSRSSDVIFVDEAHALEQSLDNYHPDRLLEHDHRNMAKLLTRLKHPMVFVSGTMPAISEVENVRRRFFPNSPERPIHVAAVPVEPRVEFHVVTNVQYSPGEGTICDERAEFSSIARPDENASTRYWTALARTVVDCSDALTKQRGSDLSIFEPEAVMIAFSSFVKIKRFADCVRGSNSIRPGDVERFCFEVQRHECNGEQATTGGHEVRFEGGPHAHIYVVCCHGRLCEGANLARRPSLVFVVGTPWPIPTRASGRQSSASAEEQMLQTVRQVVGRSTRSTVNPGRTLAVLWDQQYSKYVHHFRADMKSLQVHAFQVDLVEALQREAGA